MKWNLGRGRYGQVEAVLDTCWQEFAEFLRDAQRLPLSPTYKHDHWWTGPFLLNQGATQRRVEDIDHMAAWIGLDVDRDNLSINDLRVRLAGQWLAYTTASSQPDDTRWRILIALARCYTVAEHNRLWRWYAQSLPLDPQTKNANRLFYLPAEWDAADNLWYAQSGKLTDVDSILALVPEQPPSTLPPSSPPNARTLALPPGMDIVTPHMLDTAQAAARGGRLYRLMCQAAKRCRVNGWDLNAAELVHAAMQASSQFAPGRPRPNIQREAQRAIDWAAAHWSPQTPLERMRNRILWERTARPR